MFTISAIKNHLTAMGHGSTLNKVRNFEELCERTASTIILKCPMLETIRTAGLSQTVHDILYDYALPSDFNSIIDLSPQSERESDDKSKRILAEPFDLEKLFSNKRVSIESSEGTKKIRIKWDIRSAKTLNTMDSYNGNGTWSAVGTASGIATDTIYYYSGGGSVRFDSAATGDGIQATDMTQVDLSDEDEVATAVIPIYFGSVSNLTSISFIWGNDLTTNYWTGVAQTAQADGTSFKVGWNIIKVPWSTATETGTVDPTAIDAAKITVATTGTISDIRVDNIRFAIGYPFDIKYYSKYMFMNSSGTWLSKPSSDDDYVVIDNDGLQIFLLECLIQIAHQLEGTDSAFDINFAKNELAVLYPAYKGEHPSQAKKATAHYGGLPRFNR